MGSTIHTTFLFLLFAVSILAKSQGDPYDAPSSPPPSEAEFPQSLFCNDTLTKCSGKQISCRQQCPTFKASDVKSRGCFIDCNSKICEAVCKCLIAMGLVQPVTTPRFVGGDGVMFYFHGKTKEHFSLVSDTNLQINARFIGRSPREDHGTTRGSKHSPHVRFSQLNIGRKQSCKTGRQNRPVSLLTYNGTPINISLGHLSTWTFQDSGLIVERTTRCNSVSITLPGVVEIPVNVKKMTVCITIKYLKMTVLRIWRCSLSSLLCPRRLKACWGKRIGLSFRVRLREKSQCRSRVGKVSLRHHLFLSADCKYCIFKGDELHGETKSSVLDPEMIVDCTRRTGYGRGFVCRG